MPLKVGAALQIGIDRTVATNGLQFVGLFFVLNLVNVFVATAAVRHPAAGPFTSMDPVTTPLPALSPIVAGIVSFLTGIVSLVIVIAAIRTFVTPETNEIPRAHFTRNMAWAWVNFLIGGIVFGVVVAIGLVLLIIPGMFLLVTLFFWTVYVAIMDNNFIDAFQNSWSLTKGNRLRVFLLGVLVVAIGFVVGIGSNVLTAVLPGVLGLTVQAVGSAFMTVFYLATLAAAYNLLSADLMESDEAEVTDGTNGPGEFTFGTDP